MKNMLIFKSKVTASLVIHGYNKLVLPGEN
jgi:hypothetical protein